jgi:thiol-disulfide isomerase/thioredoxin
MKNAIKALVGVTIIVLIAVTILDLGGNKNNINVAEGYVGAIENASFELIGAEGRVQVSDFEGKLLLVDFWETWCVPCLNVMPTFQQLLEEYPDKFVVLAVSPGWSDTPEDVMNFRSNHEYDFIFVYDDTEVATALEIAGIPYKVFIGPDGQYISTEMGTGGAQRDYNKIVEMLQQHMGVAAN